VKTKSILPIERNYKIIPFQGHFLQYCSKHAEILPPLQLGVNDHNQVQKPTSVYALDLGKSGQEEKSVANRRWTIYSLFQINKSVK
jgi:hypothetical protein